MYCRSKYKSLRKFGSSDEANSETNMVMTGYHDTVMSCDETMMTSCHDYSSSIQPNPEFCPLLEMLGLVKITLSNPILLRNPGHAILEGKYLESLALAVFDFLISSSEAEICRGATFHFRRRKFSETH